MHRVVTDAVHTARIPTSSPASTDRTKSGRVLLQIRSCTPAGIYACHHFAVSASATRSPISHFSSVAWALSTAGVRATVRDFICCAVLARVAEYDGVEVPRGPDEPKERGVRRRPLREPDAACGGDGAGHAGGVRSGLYHNPPPQPS